MLINRTSARTKQKVTILSPSFPSPLFDPFLLRSRCVRARVTRSRRRRGERETYGKVGNRVYRGYGLVPIPSLVFVPTDLSILARCVTNVYVTTRAGRGGGGGGDKKEEGRDKWARKERKKGREKKGDGRIVENGAARRQEDSTGAGVNRARLNYC